MLVKLMKHDLKSALKILSIFYGIGLLFAVLTRVFFAVENSALLNIFGKICSGVTISMIFNIIINNVLRMWGRFRENLYGDESYLTHTLPVKRTMHYMAKAVTSLVTLLVSTVVIVLLLFVAYYSKENMEILKAFLFPVAQAYDFSVTGIVAVALAVVFLEILNTLQCGFTGIILGHRMNSGKIGFTVLFGLVIYMATSIVVVAVLAVAGIFSPDIMNVIVTADALSVDTVKTVLWLSIGVYSALAVVFCIMNAKLLERGVNVD